MFIDKFDDKLNDAPIVSVLLNTTHDIVNHLSDSVKYIDALDSWTVLNLSFVSRRLFQVRRLDLKTFTR